jgi:hypothetical protein
MTEKCWYMKTSNLLFPTLCKIKKTKRDLYTREDKLTVKNNRRESVLTNVDRTLLERFKE